MDVSPYIAELLRHNDEVNVPSLGTFHKQRKAAFYDPLLQGFFPPSHGLAFQETEDNANLAQFISKQKSVSANTANYFIDKFVAQTKSQLEIYGYAEIESLGTLKRAGEGYIFIDAVNFDEEGDYYGLEPVQQLPELENPAGAIAATEDEQPKNIGSVEEDDPEASFEIETAEVRRMSGATKLVLIAASLILIGVVSYLIYPQAFEVFRQKNQLPAREAEDRQAVKALPVKTMADSVAEADTIYQELAKEGFEVEKPRDTIEVSTQAQTVITPEVSFEIIGAAFARKADADRFVKQLTDKGVYAKIVENMPGSKLKISLGSFNTETAAQQELIRVKKELNKDAWIARVKPKINN